MSLLTSTPADVEIANPPQDSISSLAWSPTADLLAVSSWSNEVRIYEVAANGTSEGRAMYSHEAPALCVKWSKDGSKIVSGGADNAARLYDAASGQATQIGAHDAPVRCVEWIDMGGQSVVCTGSWDKTLKYWNLRQSTPIAQVQLPERCYTMDCVAPLLVVGTAEKHLLVFNLNNPTTPYKTLASPLHMQTRSVACFPDATGFALSSIEGRVAIQYIDDSQTSQNFSFKCHRADLKPSPGPPFKTGSQVVASVNQICFHPAGTFATAGSDGIINMWDHYARSRLKTLPNLGGPITAAAFSRTGHYLAYAISYDWSQGFMGNAGISPKVKLHLCQEEEVKRRAAKK
ncbi:hypothetical protein JCM10207_000735 [Rhodosporidiobolus poonsookiae]